MSSFDHDPVKDLFDSEREQIVSQHGNDMHWQSIVRRARAHFGTHGRHSSSVHATRLPVSTPSTRHTT